MVGCGGEGGMKGERRGKEMDGSVGRRVGALGARDFEKLEGMDVQGGGLTAGGWAECDGGAGKRSCGLWSVGDWR